MPKKTDSTMHIKDLFEDRAREGEGLFAVAYALLEVSESQSASARALARLGFGNASTDLGAIEGMTIEVRDALRSVSEAIEQVAGSISSIGSIE